VLTRSKTIGGFAAALVLGASAAPVASAQYDNEIVFRSVHDGTSKVEATTREPLDNAVLVVVRQQAVIAKTLPVSGPIGAGVSVSLPDLLPGDEASFYADENLKLLARGTYAGDPQITNACVGATSFTVSSPGVLIEYAGTSVLLNPPGGYGTSDAAFGPIGTTTVMLQRPIAATDVVYAASSYRTLGMKIRYERSVRPVVCPPPPVVPPAPAPTPAPPSDAAVLSAVKAAAATTGAELRKHKQFAKLPFAFPEPGTVQLKLAAKGKTIAGGLRQRTSAGKANVTVKQTSAGRKVLKRFKTLKLTLTATFTPSRANAKAQRAVVKVTLKR
jgi:hypothetical protein